MNLIIKAGSFHIISLSCKIMFSQSSTVNLCGWKNIISVNNKFVLFFYLAEMSGQVVLNISSW